jgi:hypothetical protein
MPNEPPSLRRAYAQVLIPVALVRMADNKCVLPVL